MWIVCSRFPAKNVFAHHKNPRKTVQQTKAHTHKKTANEMIQENMCCHIRICKSMTVSFVADADICYALCVRLSSHSLSLSLSMLLLLIILLWSFTDVVKLCFPLFIHIVMCECAIVYRLFERSFFLFRRISFHARTFFARSFVRSHGRWVILTVRYI